MKRQRWVRKLLSMAALGFISFSGYSENIAQETECKHCAWQEWPIVGRAELSVFIFDVYKSVLLSPTGRYQLGTDVSPHPLALSIEYQRSISQEQLLEATYEQWIEQGYDKAQAQRWITQLAAIFPNVKEGQRLTYITNGESGHFEFSPNPATTQVLGAVNNEQLNDAFLAIWLSPKTQYADLRRKLIGQTK